MLTATPIQRLPRTAEQTIAKIPQRSLAAILAAVSAESQARFAAKGIQPAGTVPASDAPLIDAEPRGRGSAGRRGAAVHAAAHRRPQRGQTHRLGDEGDAGRARDPDPRPEPHSSPASVLSSPKMNDTEVAAIAKMQNVSEDVLRTIAMNRAWLKNYSVVLAVVKNPKTPVALSMNLMARLSEKDLKLLTTDRNVPDALRTQARGRSPSGDK
jgi:hypothetical protein